ncbi:Polysulfide reductase NrfD [Sulfidibacter corallicola]|uniref:Polysulfide reductase NrfD n=1 Tax=Sulfidibacter corallicola TaxID=2818388 RepID=A0A8A4TQ71_SULCO|nr:NrfD/PsrC family molybdoenzyme membrane anchor subunit [Sulfidibacter corallicola]QTD51334.1 polysulfide reductase NrfD [Sulfidibacter corallicola]
MSKPNPIHFFKDAFVTATSGSLRYHLWMGCLTFLMILGSYAYWVQLREGLVVTGMTDHVSWGMYISNFTFLVGLAAAAVMLVLPTYILDDVDFGRAVLIGEGVAVSALVMCLAFVTVDLGGPHRAWHLIPKLGYFNWPQSLLTWDVLVLNGYLALNLLIPFYILYSHYKGEKPDKRKYLPFVVLSVFWAVGIHLVTAFLYAGLPARPFWHNALLGPRFLASAFAAGPGFIILVLGVIHTQTAYTIRSVIFDKLAMITTVAAQINLVMLGSELFVEFYHPTEHAESAMYLFFGLDGHDALVPWIRTAIVLNVVATVVLSLHPLRRRRPILLASCALLFLAIWIEKGMGMVVPGFIPGPLGDVVDYSPTWVEIWITGGIWAMGFFFLSALTKVAIEIETGRMVHVSARKGGEDA